MKLQSIIPAIPLALWSSSVHGAVYVGNMPNLVDVGKTYSLNWTATVNYTYNLWLVLDDPNSNAYEWTKVQTLASGLVYKTLSGSFPFTVPSNLSADSAYGIWFGCFPIPDTNGTYMYTNITNYFSVSTSSLASSTASATVSRTSTPTSSGSAATSSAASNDTASGSHHSSLSGGAIAGIVIGVLVLIALAIAALFFRRWRKKKTNFEKREAAARANRLEPVMQAGHSSFEMQGRGPRKEVNV